YGGRHGGGRGDVGGVAVRVLGLDGNRVGAASRGERLRVGNNRQLHRRSGVDNFRLRRRVTQGAGVGNGKRGAARYRVVEVEGNDAGVGRHGNRPRHRAARVGVEG